MLCGVLQYHGSQIPENTASFFIGNEIIDLVAHVDFEVFSCAEQKTIDLGHGEVKRLFLTVDRSFVGQALTVEGADTLACVAVFSDL